MKLNDIKNTKSFFSSLSHATLSNLLTVMTVTITLWFTVIRRPVQTFFEQQSGLIATVNRLEQSQRSTNAKIDSLTTGQQALSGKLEQNIKLSTAKLNTVAGHINRIEEGNSRIFEEFEELKQIQHFWTVPVLGFMCDTIHAKTRGWTVR